MNNFRYVPSFYFPEQAELPQQPVVEAPVEEPVTAIEEDEGLLTAVEPEPIREPVFSSYFDEDNIPAIYRMSYAAPSMTVAPPAPVRVARVAPVQKSSAAIPEDYFLRPVEATPVAPVASDLTASAVVAEAVSQVSVDHFLPKEDAPAKKFSRTYNAYNKGEPSSDYAWAEDNKEEPVLQEFTLVKEPYQPRHRVQEESMYIGFQNDVFNAYNRSSVPASYSIVTKEATPAPVVAPAPTPAPAPVEASVSAECVTAPLAEVAPKSAAPAAPRSRFVGLIKEASLPLPQKEVSMEYADVEGDAFRPVVLPQSEYQFDGLNDLVSYIDIRH